MAAAPSASTPPSHMTAAIALYRDLGYREIPAYNEGPNADLWFERELR